MSLKICFDTIKNTEPPFFEEQIEENIDFSKQFAIEQTLGLSLTYEQAPICLKTYLSIKYNEDKPYNIMFCAPEIVLKILKLKSGHVYAPYFPMSFNFLSCLQMSVDVDVIREGKRVHCNTLEEVLMQKSISKRHFNKAFFNTWVTNKYQYQLEKVKVSIRKSEVRLLSNNPINYNLTINHSKICYTIYLVGDTGGVVERVVDFILQEEMAAGNNDIIYLNFNDLGNNFNEFINRCVVFCSNVFDFMFNDMTQKLIVLNSVDALWLKNKVLYDALVEHLLKNKVNRYLIFSRIISNEFSDCEIATIADVTVDRIYKEVSIDIKAGEKL